MNANSIRGRALPAAALLIALVTVVAVVASGALGRAGDPGNPTPSAPPSAAPTPTPTPTPSPTPEPTDTPGDGNFIVDLNTVDDHDVTIVVEDRTGTVVDVSSGNAGDGMSVRWLNLKVENLDAETLRLTWVGLPRDEAVRLFVSHEDGKVRLLFVQAAPPINPDALGFDRIVVLKFDAPVRAEEVLWSMQEGFDTSN